MKKLIRKEKMISFCVLSILWAVFIFMLVYFFIKKINEINEDIELINNFNIKRQEAINRQSTDLFNMRLRLEKLEKMIDVLVIEKFTCDFEKSEEHEKK